MGGRAVFGPWAVWTAVTKPHPSLVSSSSSAASARWPVRWRNTSSRLGRARPRSSSSMPLDSKTPAIRVMSPRPLACAVSRRLPRSTWTSAQQEFISSAARSRSAAWVRVTTTLARPAWSFSWVGVPAAMTLPLSTTTISSARWSASSRYCVVSTSVVPSLDEFPQHRPQPRPALRVQPGGGLVEEQDGRGGQQADREVEPAAHAARVRLRHAVGRQSVRSKRSRSVSVVSRTYFLGSPYRLPISLRFSRPVRISSTVAA